VKRVVLMMMMMIVMMVGTTMEEVVVVVAPLGGGSSSVPLVMVKLGWYQFHEVDSTIKKISFWVFTHKVKRSKLEKHVPTRVVDAFDGLEYVVNKRPVTP